MRAEVDFRLLAVTDRKRLGGTPLDDWLAVLCWHGLRGVMLREKDLPEDELERLAGACREIFDRHRVSWLVNGAVGVAVRAGATGVHLPGNQEPGPARTRLGEAALIGRSVHGLEEARSCERAGVDYLVFGPVYATPSKAGSGPPQGLDRLREVCRAVSVPVFAIGGVTPDRAEACRHAGAHGVAVLSALMATTEPEETLAKYEHALDRL